ncbi:hypothetical protein F4212_03020 [Candidatus Poribacteria bacterium]|nr:hypothetical protein [Candidatus Poribacteria bacterium]
MSIKNLSEMMGISFSYVSKIVKRISRFLKKVKSNRKGTIFNVIHYDFTEALTEEEKKEFDRTFAVPYGLGSPIEAMFRGKSNLDLRNV